MSNPNCVSERALRAFLVGELPELSAQLVVTHLEGCPRCTALARHLDDISDPVIQSLRCVLRPGPTPSPHGADTVVQPPPPNGVAEPVQIGNYTILGELGRGGMAVVYKARQQHPERFVALKVLLAGRHSGSERQARFRAEADAIARLRHPHIVQVFEAGEHDGLPYLALEFCEGGSLAQRLGGAPLSPRQSPDLVEPLARAVQHAHDAGVVHRDLKPANVLLQFSILDFGFSIEEDRLASGPDRQSEIQNPKSKIQNLVPKITDFGLARWERPELTATGAVLGTPSYMAPEQAEGKSDVGAVADVYALGAILYELLTGRPPFQGATPLETLEQVRHQEPVPPRHFQPGVPRDLETICLKCLQKEPARRYASAGALADDLLRFRQGRPVQARPVSAAQRTWRWARRNPLWASTLAGIAGLLLAVAVGASWMTWKLNMALEASRVEQENAKEAEKDTRAFADFLTNRVLAASRPEGVQEGIGVNVTMAEALEKADAHMDSVFADRPKAEAEARQAIGVTWRNLGRFPEAIRNLRRALDLRQEALGSDATETLFTKNSLAMAYLWSGQVDRGLALLEEILVTRRQVLGPDHPDTLGSQTRLGEAHKISRHPERGVPLLKEALEKQARLLGAAHVDTVLTQIGLAETLRAAGRADSAVPLLEQVLAHFRKTVGATHASSVRTMGQLAQAYQDLGRTDRAVPLNEQVLEYYKDKNGPNHPVTLITMNNLADCYQTARRFDRAVPLYEKSLARHKEKLGPDHYSTLSVMDNLATAYQDIGQPALALPLYQEALARSRKALGRDHPTTLQIVNNLASLYWSERQLDKSVPLFEEILPLYEKEQGANHFATIRTAFNLAVNYLQSNQVDRATTLCDRWLPRASALPTGQPVRASAESNAIAIYYRAHRLDKAEPILRARADAVKAKTGPESPPYADQLAVLATNLLTQNKHTEAEQVARACLAIRQKNIPDDWTTFNSQSLLGGVLLAQRKYTEAEPLLVKGYEGMKQRAAKIPPQGKPRLTEALQRLVQLYDDWGKNEQADQWRRELEPLEKRQRDAGTNKSQKATKKD
jgi:serine/threonine protein kinase